MRDPQRVDPNLLRAAVGSSAEWLRQLADGIDDRPVEPHQEAKSSGTENTFAEDLTDTDMTSAASWLSRK